MGRDSPDPIITRRERMKKRTLFALAILAALLAGGLRPAWGGAAPAADGKPRIICIGAHPDDAESGAAGTAALWIAKGYHVKFVSVTNGDIGHWKESGPELARRRKDEGELQPTLENRRTITRLIREWQADVVITHRPNDYHPDHRYTSVLVQDSAYMVTVPNIVALTPHLRVNPVYVYVSDNFTKPYPFTPDVVVDIDEVVEQKLEALHQHTSQMYEWLAYNA